MRAARCASAPTSQRGPPGQCPRRENRFTYPALATQTACDLQLRNTEIPGGAEGDRTLDLRIANATLSQLSYRPTRRAILASDRRAATRHYYGAPAAASDSA